MAIGPRAAHLIECGHVDLELVDVLVADDAPSRAELAWLAASHVLERSFTVVVFDAIDEALWPAARDIVREARLRTTLPVWLVHPDSRGEHPRGRMLANLARELAVCVVDPGACETLDVALMAVAGLARTGLTGFDPADLSTVACRGAVGRAQRVADVASDSTIDRALVVMRCSSEVSLHGINKCAGELSKRLPAADLLYATPTHSDASERTLDVHVLVFSSPAAAR